MHASAAFAQEIGWSTWTDPTGQLSFQYPTGWYVNPMRSQTEGAVRVSVGAGDYECQIWSLPRANSASASPDAVRQRYSQPIEDSAWVEIVSPLREFEGGVTVEQQGVDTSGAWPVQRVRLPSPEHQARGTIQGRPGRELISLCLSFDGQDRNETFERIERSVGLPGDAPAS